VTSSDQKLAARVQWDLLAQPYLWFWQEFGGTRAYPWWAAEYLVGLEPWSSVPGSGLAEAVATATALIIEPGKSRSTSMSIDMLER
jgi:hypothetical protein